MTEAPSVWQRFLTRALYVKSRPEFRRQTALAREDWRSAHPRLADGVNGWGTLALADDWKPPRPNVRYPYPPNLESYLARNLAPHELVADLDAIGARHDWDQAVSRLSAEWWPARYYAHWRTPWDNPSHPFVAACLRWGLGDVEPDQWIPGAPQAIYRTGFIRWS